MIPVKVLALRPGASLPAYQTGGSAGADLMALLDEPVVIEPGNRALIPTGIALELPVGYEAQVRPRSGLAAKAGLTVLNAPGTIDSDYRGEVSVILINHGSEPAIIRDGDRIAQLVIAPVVQASFSLVHELDSTERGSGGFGSTGV